jgi:hypothetical protein
MKILLSRSEQSPRNGRRPVTRRAIYELAPSPIPHVLALTDCKAYPVNCQGNSSIIVHSWLLFRFQIPVSLQVPLEYQAVCLLNSEANQAVVPHLSYALVSCLLCTLYCSASAPCNSHARRTLGGPPRHACEQQAH